MGGCFSKADGGGAAPPNNNQNQGGNASNNNNNNNNNQNRHSRHSTRSFLGRGSRSTGNTPRASTSTVHPNKPLVPLPEGYRCKLPDVQSVPTSNHGRNPDDVRWTHEKLEQERNDWWETHSTTGDPQIWATYREIIKCLQQGKVKEAQTLLDAAGCTCPDGKAWIAIYDERGKLYHIRDLRGTTNYDYVVFEPEGLVDGDEFVQKEGEGEEVQVEGKGKGKAVVRDDDHDLGELVEMRCRVSLGSDEKVCVIEAREREKAGVIKAKLSPIVGCSASRITVVYYGRVYEDDQHLQNWKRGNTLTVRASREESGHPSGSSKRKNASTGQSSETLIAASRESPTSEQPPRIPTPEQHPPLTAPSPRSPTPASDRQASRPTNEQQSETTPGNPLRKSASSGL